MATNKKLISTRLSTLLLAAAMAWITGCGPPGPRALVEGRRLLDAGKFAPAIEELKVATQLMETNAQAWNSLGVACHHAGQFDAAAEAYQRALKLDRDLVVAH